MDECSDCGSEDLNKVNGAPYHVCQDCGTWHEE